MAGWQVIENQRGERLQIASRSGGLYKQTKIYRPLWSKLRKAAWKDFQRREFLK